MALWDRISSRGQVEDRRGVGPVAVGGMGVVGLGMYLLMSLMSGSEINLPDVLGQLEQIQTQNQQPTDPSRFEGADAYEVFASTVLGSNNDAWRRVFSEQNIVYREPRLVLFRQATDSGCGTATSRVGPHYCPVDETIYLDETFFDELQSRFGAQGGDVAQAYVIAHEVGHHVQNLLGVFERVVGGSRFGIEPNNELSIKTELQADCYAGIWANSIADQGVLLPDEIREALDAAAAVGDDRIQERVQGYIQPETWTHGSSEQRTQWFIQGYQTGNIDSCNTFVK